MVQPHSCFFFFFNRTELSSHHTVPWNPQRLVTSQSVRLPWKEASFSFCACQQDISDPSLGFQIHSPVFPCKWYLLGSRGSPGLTSFTAEVSIDLWLWKESLTLWLRLELFFLRRGGYQGKMRWLRPQARPWKMSVEDKFKVNRRQGMGRA